MFVSKLKKHCFAIIASLYSMIVMLFWLALRVNWSGISKFLGADTNPSFFVMQTPLLVFILLVINLIFSTVMMFVFSGKKIWPFIVSLAISVVFTVGIVVVYLNGANDYIQFILPKFWRSLLVAVALILFALLLFFPTTNSKRAIILKSVCVGCAVLLAILVGYNVQINKFTYGAVVYAVEDDYQITFSTSDNSIAWVEVDGQKYYDLYAGSMKSKDLIHKVTLPQSALDSAKSYKICAQQMIYRGPFGGYLGKVISQDYTFRPIDPTNGITYYTMTDVHGAIDGAVKAYNTVENVELLVMLGDNTSMVDSSYDAQFTNMLASKATNGQIPCVYARGNHEVKGDYAEDLYKYVGSKNGSFYYYFTLSDSVFGIVLDLGEDHDDDWWEYYQTAQFDLYRNEQTEWLTELMQSKPYLDYDYTMVCCHIPVQFVNSRLNHEQVKANWTALLNEIQPDIVLEGHQHECYAFIEDTIELTENHKLQYNINFKQGKNGAHSTYGGYVTDFDFNAFICGKRGTDQTDEPGSTELSTHVGFVTQIDFATNKQTCYFINSDGNKVSVYEPFTDTPLRTEFVLELK